MAGQKRQNFLLGGFIAALLALLCLASTRAKADPYEYVGTSHSALGAVGMDARAASLGWAVTSLDMGVAGMEFNPASLAFRNSSQLYFGHTRWVLDVPLDQALYSRPLGGNATIAFGLLHMDMGSVSQTLEDGSYSGESFGARDMQFSANFTMPVHPLLRVGARASFLYKNLADESAGTFMGSVGLLTQEVSGIRLGASLLDVGPPFKFVSMSVASPWRARFGASHRLELAEGHRLVNSLDLVYPRDNHPSVGFGSEWTWNDLLFLRVGYRRTLEDDGTPEGDRFHYGGGLCVNHFRFDYAFGAREDFQSVHRLAVTFDLGGSETVRTTPEATRYLHSSDPEVLRKLQPENVRVIPVEPQAPPADELTVFPNLAFSADRSALLSGHYRMVDEFVERLKATPGLLGIELQGYENDSGEPVWDRKRSLQKIQAFKDALIVRGVPADMIGLMAYGSERPQEGVAPTRIEVHLIR